jgi:uncharacterized protein
LPRKIVWKYLKDKKVLRDSIPGCRDFSESSRGFYNAEIEINFGPLKDVFILEIRVVDEKPLSFYQLLVKGKGNLGEINGKAELYLNESQGSTKLTIKADAEVTGALSGAAQRVLNGGSNKGIENFLQRLEKEIKRSLYLIRRGK